MRLPIRPLRLIHDFCAFREVAYGRRIDRHQRHDVFHISSTRYELLRESGVVLVSSLAKAFLDDVVVLDPAPHRLGKVDEEHAVTVANHAGMALVRVYHICPGNPRAWSLVASLVGEASQCWEISNAHRLGISVVARDLRTHRCSKVVDWDWRNDRVVRDTWDPIADPHHSPIPCPSLLCQIRNTRFLDDSVVDWDGTCLELDEGNRVNRIPSPPTTVLTSSVHHILDGALSYSSPRSFSIYVILERSAEGVGFTILDWRAMQLRAVQPKPKGERAGERAAAATARLGGDGVVEWIGHAHDWSLSSELPIEIDGEGDEWVRLAVFGTRNIHYAVDVCLRTWTCTLIGFFRLRDPMAIPLGVVHWQDPNVGIIT
jgi:hypothetical protein